MWRGNFSQLVERVNEKLKEQGDGKLVNERLLRDYQNKGLLGRGTPLNGRAREFTEDDVLSVLATRGLIKSGVGLSLAKPLLEQSTAADYAQYAQNVVRDDRSTAAVDKVAELIKRTQPPLGGSAVSYVSSPVSQNAAAGAPPLQQNTPFLGVLLREVPLGHEAKMLLPEPLTQKARHGIISSIEQELERLRQLSL